MSESLHFTREDGALVLRGEWLPTIQVDASLLGMADPACVKTLITFTTRDGQQVYRVTGAGVDGRTLWADRVGEPLT